jgi:CHRD domain
MGSSRHNKERTMRQTIRLSSILAMALTIAVVPPVAADEVKTRLSGYQETPLTINSTGSGEFTAKISNDGTMIDYEITYRDLTTAGTPNVQQAHIHFGRPAITGQIVLFLCTNLTPPAGVPTPQACPSGPGEHTIKGTLTAADVIARPTQGIDAGAAGLAEMIKAMHNGAAYANVHTATFPSGEIRGRLGRPHDRP